MTSELQNFYAEQIYGTNFDRLPILEKERVLRIIHEKIKRGEITL